MNPIYFPSNSSFLLHNIYISPQGITDVVSCYSTEEKACVRTRWLNRVDTGYSLLRSFLSPLYPILKLPELSCPPKQTWRPTSQRERRALKCLCKSKHRTQTMILTTRSMAPSVRRTRCRISSGS